MYKICFYVPEENLEAVKDAIFAAGAGQLGAYQKCAWQTLGTGQFLPLHGAEPHLGEVAELAHVREYKVELVCQESAIKAALQALKTSHPYEEPAYQVFKMEDLFCS